MHILSVVLATYVLYAFILVSIVLCVQHRDRFPSIVVGLLFPGVLFAAVFGALASSNEPVKPCPNGLEEAEALLEQKRQLMFQNAPVQPNIANSWKRRYAMSVEMQARKVRELSIEVKHLLATV